MAQKLRWTIDLNMKGKTIRFLEANTGKYIYDLEVNKYFLHRIQERQ